MKPVAEALQREPVEAVVHAPTASALPRAQGRLRIAFARVAGRSVLRDLYQAGCARARLPRGAPDAPPDAILLNTAGGLTGGDRLAQEIRVDTGAQAVIATQAAEKLYRAADLAPAVVETRLRIGEGASLSWLPQETILFDRSRLRRRTLVEIAPGGRLLAVENLVFGRHAHGETYAEGFLHDRWRVRRAGRLVWADDLRLGGDAGAPGALLARPALFAGAKAAASLVYAGPDAADWLAPLRGWLSGLDCLAGASERDGLLLARLLADDAGALRRGLVETITAWRGALAGRATPMPRVWLC